MGGGSKPKQQVSNYYLSQHFGVCHTADAIKRIRVKEKDVFVGRMTANTTVNVDQPDLFGGVKKEGGLRGQIHALFGGATQTISEYLAAKLGGTSATVPGFRGITSLFFTGGGPEGQAGFYWSSNSPYLPSVDVTVESVVAVGGGWYSEKSNVPLSGTAVLTTDDIYLAFSATEGMGTARFAQTIEAVKRVVARIAELQGTRQIRLKIVSFRDTASPTAEFVSTNPKSDTAAINTFLDSVPFGGNTYTQSRITAYGPMVGFFQSAQPRDNVAVVVSAAGETFSNFITDIPGFPDMYDRALDPYSDASGTAVKIHSVILGDGVSGGALSNNGSTQITSVTTDAIYNAIVGQLALTYDAFDMNPAHIIRACLTNQDWGLGLPDSMIDDTSFRAAADTLFSEGLGLSMMWSQQADIESFINDVLGHIDGMYGIDPATGKIFITLARGGYNVATLQELTPDNCRVTRFQRKTLADTTNEVVVTWTNPENEQEETVVVHDLANYAMQGVLVSSSSNFYGVRTAELALRLAMRALTRSSALLAAFDIEVNRTAWAFKPGDVVKLTYPQYGISGLPIRILNINYGKPGAMTITLNATEDVFEMPTTAYVDVVRSEYSDPVQTPMPIDLLQGGSAPYYFVAQEAGSAAASALPYGTAFGVTLADQTNGDSTVFDLLTPSTDSLGNTNYTAQEFMDMAVRTTLSAPLGLEVTSTPTLTDAVSAVAGQFVWIGTTPATSELALVASVSPLTIKRGVLDTTPKEWPAGTPVWFVTGDVSDDTERLSGQTVAYKLISRTSSGTQPIADAANLSVTLDDRIHRPYRPANLRVNGALWPAYIGGTDDLSITWSSRNRLTEDPVVQNWDATSVTAEADTTYTLRIYGETGALGKTETGLTGLTYSYPLATEVADFSIPAGSIPDAVTRSAMGATISGLQLWQGAVKATNGKIYGIPREATDILIIDPVAGTATRSAMGASLSGVFKWSKGVLAADGKIYCPPWNATNILIIDPIAGTATRSTMGASLSGSSKWNGCELGNDGKIYCVPDVATNILIINPAAGTATRSTMGASLSGTAGSWFGAVKGTNGKIYCIPYVATDILIIDPATGTATRSTMGASLSGSNKWSGGALGDDGKIYCVPGEASDILIIDPIAGTATRSNMGADLSGSTNKWYGAVKGSNGKIYGIPRDATDILVIDPATGTATRVNPGAPLDGTFKWTLGALADDGAIYGVPGDAADIIKIVPGVASSYRPNGSLRIEVESVRDGLTSYQKSEVTVRREGYGYNYGMFYGGQ